MPAQALIDVFTARAFVRLRKIKAFDKVAAGLEKAIRNRRHKERAHQTAMRKKMLLRHDSERRRDEVRIAAMARGARSKGASERGRKVFNWRGGVETARHVPSNQPVVSLSRIHAAISNSAEGLRERGRNALSAITHVLGRGVPVEQLRKSTVGGWSSMPPPTDNAAQREPAPIVTVPTEAEAKSPPKSVEVGHAHDDKANRSDRQVPPITPAAHHERTMFEALRDARLA